MDNYQILGVPYNADQRAIKRAYAALIKQYRPDSHPVEFARIRAAYEKALEQCRYREQYEYHDETSDSETVANTDTEESGETVEPVIEQQIEKIDEQTENNDDSFNRLVDKPVIQLSKDEPEIENSGDRYSRLVEKPVIEQTEKATETSLSVEKPIIQQQSVELDSNVDDLAWVEKPAINISALIEQLIAYQQPDNEQTALTCFQTQLSDFAAMNLDQRMDYEEKLYASLLYNDRPSLLLFAAASEYFDWTNSISWIKSSQSKWSKQRFDALSKLSALYRQIRTRYNPYFQAKHDVELKSCRLTTHYHHQQAQDQCIEWHYLCQTGLLKDLDAYFADKPAQRPLYIIDVLFGVWLGYLVLQNYSLSVWLMPAVLGLGGFLFSWLLLGWRTLNLNISSGTIWIVVCVLIVLMARLPEAFGSVMFMVLFCAVLLGYLHSWLTKLEIATAKTVDRIRQSSLVRKKILSQQTLNPKKAAPTMNKQIYPLLIAQFLSAFGDNAILFTVIAMVMQAAEAVPKWYIPALQAVFLIAYVVLGPWVGGIADRHAKARVLLVANIIKAVGAGLLLIHVEPLLAYAIVGVGAAAYSPAKYGILPELVGHDNLVKANSWIEGSTILAIILGMKIGADVADYSISMALMGTVALFMVSALATLSLPIKISKKDGEEIALVEFGKQMALFFTTPRSRFAVLGASLFWAAAASLRVILIAWAPLILMAKNASEIANLTLFLTFGIIAGSIAVPRIIPLEHLRRARIPAYIMGVLITCLSLTTDTFSARTVLFGIGIVGGMFIVPVNASLQEQGKLTIGSGSAVALQNFFQNLSMLLAVGAYTLAASQQVDPVIAMFILGILVFLTAFVVSLRLPEKQTE